MSQQMFFFFYKQETLSWVVREVGACSLSKRGSLTTQLHKKHGWWWWWWWWWWRWYIYIYIYIYISMYTYINVILRKNGYGESHAILGFYLCHQPLLLPAPKFEVLETCQIMFPIVEPRWRKYNNLHPTPRKTHQPPPKKLTEQAGRFFWHRKGNNNSHLKQQQTTNISFFVGFSYSFSFWGCKCKQ